MSIAVPISLKTRLAALTGREKSFLGAGAASILLFLYIITPSADQAGVELAAAPPPSVTAAPPPAPAPPAPASPPSQAPASAEGILLQGVLGGGVRGGSAILLLQGGGQRIVRTGREIRPGLLLKSIGVSHAIVGTSVGDIRLEMGRAGGAAVPSESSARSAPSGEPTSGSRQAMAYRLGLQPVKSDGRTKGFAIRPGAALPPLQQAGLRPGDVLMAVNGQAIESEEKVQELAQEIATSYTAEFEFLRNGRRMKASLQVNKRPGE